MEPSCQLNRHRILMANTVQSMYQCWQSEGPKRAVFLRLVTERSLMTSVSRAFPNDAACRHWFTLSPLTYTYLVHMKVNSLRAPPPKK